MNSGHPNLDNNAEIYSVGKMFQFISSRIIYRPQKWVSLEIEPYLISHSGISNMNQFKVHTNLIIIIITIRIMK